MMPKHHLHVRDFGDTVDVAQRVAHPLDDIDVRARFEDLVRLHVRRAVRLRRVRIFPDILCSTRWQ